jgi:hypothetical protein
MPDPTKLLPDVIYAAATNPICETTHHAPVLPGDVRMVGQDFNTLLPADYLCRRSQRAGLIASFAEERVELVAFSGVHDFKVLTCYPHRVLVSP